MASHYISPNGHGPGVIRHIFVGVVIFLGAMSMVYIAIKDGNDPIGETAQLANHIRQEQHT
jgi:hypothetical protein